MKSLIILLIASLVAASSTFAADGQFKVLSSKGEITFQQGNSGDWFKLKTGDALGAADVVKLAKGAYLGLTYSKGGTLELTKQGSYKIADLVKKVADKKADMSKKFLDYVVGEISESNDIISKNKGQEGEVKGAVERGGDVLVYQTVESENTATGEGAETEAIVTSGSYHVASYLYPTMPQKSSLITPDVVFTWVNSTPEKDFDFVICDRFDKEVARQPVKTNKFEANLKKMNIQPGYYYFWNVVAKKDSIVQSERCAFILLDAQKTTAINDTLSKLKAEFGTEQSAIHKIVLAKFYELNDLNIDADREYGEALKLAPDVEEYKNIYDGFMKRNMVLK